MSISPVLRRDFVPYLTCPKCQHSLSLSSPHSSQILRGTLSCDNCGREYPIVNGVPNLVVTESLHQSDITYSAQADSYARFYEQLIKIMSLGLLLWEPRERKRWIQGLNLQKGSWALDISTGTGLNLFLIDRYVGKSGKIIGLDLSKVMLGLTRRKLQKKPLKAETQLHRADACYLPYKTNSFDVVVHSGGINTFGDRKRALYEMIRVAKPGSRLRIVDEGLSPRRAQTWLGRKLASTNSLYLSRPPVNLLPHGIPYRLSWVFRETFYCIDLQKPIFQKA